MPHNTEAKAKEYRMRYYQENKERIDKRNREWREKNKERDLENRRKYYLKHKEKAIESADKHRKKKEDWFWGYIDAYCRHCFYDNSRAALQIHHLNPSQKKNGKDNFSSWIRKLSFENFKIKAMEHDYIVLCANCHAELHAGLWSVKKDYWSDSWIWGREELDGLRSAKNGR